MLQARDLRGVVGMMPAFTTEDGNDPHSTSTIAVGNLVAGVNRMIGDGIDAIATTGSFGECHTLLDDEFETLARTTVETARRRIPVIIGCTSLNTRHAIKKMEIARDAGADAVLVGVPFYFPSTVENAVRFYQRIAEMFPSLGIMIYHNPDLHRITLPVEAFRALRDIPNVVAMKDSHRDRDELQELMRLVEGRISVFVNQLQYQDYAAFGVAGCWSISAWLGPWPLLRLRDAIRSGDTQRAIQITEWLPRSAGVQDLHWRESTSKLAMNLTGYCHPGPLRPPFEIIPEAVRQNARTLADAWTSLCERLGERVSSAVAV